MPLPERLDVAVVITGASRGLGAGLAEAMAARGVRLALCARTAPALPPGGDGLTAAVDVRDAEAVERFARAAVARLGRIDLWINNAGVLEPIVAVRDLSAEALSEHLAVNVIGALNGTRAFVRHLRRRGGEGVLVNVSSGAASRAYAGWGAYCAGKAALERLTEVVALEEEAHGLRAYAVSPGVIDTAMQATIRAQDRAVFPALDKFLELKRSEAFSTPAHVARELLALAFDPAARPREVAVRLAPGK